ncbi:MAG: hypothetical protein WCF17_18180 [Terracidiphilus sp.]
MSATPQVPEEENDEQLKIVCALAREATSASTERMSSLFLRALRKRMVAAPNKPDAKEAGAPGKHGNSRFLIVLSFWSLSISSTPALHGYNQSTPPPNAI